MEGQRADDRADRRRSPSIALRRWSLLVVAGSVSAVFSWACGSDGAGSSSSTSPDDDASLSGDASSPDGETSLPDDDASGVGAGEDAGPWLQGCESDAATGEGASIATYDASTCGDVATVEGDVCPLDKIVFRQCNACLNDGAIELCVNKDDEATLCAVQAIAPSATVGGSRGRIGCSDEQSLVLISMDGQECTGPNHWTANDELWSRICAIAALAGVEKIAPMFAE